MISAKTVLFAIAFGFLPVSAQAESLSCVDGAKLREIFKAAAGESKIKICVNDEVYYLSHPITELHPQRAFKARVFSITKTNEGYLTYHLKFGVDSDSKIMEVAYSDVVAKYGCTSRYLGNEICVGQAILPLDRAGADPQRVTGVGLDGIVVYDLDSENSFYLKSAVRNPQTGKIVTIDIFNNVDQYLPVRHQMTRTGAN